MLESFIPIYSIYKKKRKNGQNVKYFKQILFGIEWPHYACILCLYDNKTPP